MRAVIGLGGEHAGDGWNPAAPAALGYLTKSDAVYLRLRQLVLSAELAPGATIDQARLSASLGVSRMPLRQALIRLEAEGLVRLYPHHSATVSPILAEDITEIYTARAALEEILIRRAVPRLTADDDAQLRELCAATHRAVDGEPREFARVDRQFHTFLYRVAHYARTLGYFENLRDLSDRYVASYYSRPNAAFARDAELSASCHEEILAACLARNAGAAVKAMRADLRRTADDLLRIAMAAPNGDGGEGAAPGKQSKRRGAT